MLLVYNTSRKPKRYVGPVSEQQAWRNTAASYEQRKRAEASSTTLVIIVIVAKTSHLGTGAGGEYCC